MDPCLHKPTLTEGDLVLRPFRREDGGRMLEILKIPEVLFLTGSVESREEAENPTFDAKEIEQWYGSLSTAKNRLDLAIEYKGVVIGELVLNEYDQKKSEANFRVLMDTHHTSKRIGSKSIELFLEYASINLPIRKIVLGVLEFNDRARHVYEKVGFTFQYREEKAHRFDGRDYAMDHYERINDNEKNVFSNE